MAITSSAKKAIRSSKRKKAFNDFRKKRMKLTIKKIGKLVKEKKTDEARALLPELYKNIDKAAKMNTIKKGTADRKKSRISQMIKKVA